jgi:hypothetical protein
MLVLAIYCPYSLPIHCPYSLPIQYAVIRQ